VLNLAFLAGIGWKLASSDEPGQPPNPATQDLLALEERLSLTPQQWQFFEQSHADLVRFVQERHRSMDELRSHLWALLASDHPDHDRIESAMSAVLAAQRGAQRAVVDHLIRLRASLDGKQKLLFDEFLANLRGCPMHRSSCAGGGSSSVGPEVTP